MGALAMSAGNIPDYAEHCLYATSFWLAETDEPSTSRGCKEKYFWQWNVRKTELNFIRQTKSKLSLWDSNDLG